MTRIVTGNARMTLGAAEGEAAARDVVSLGEAAGVGHRLGARSALNGVEAACAMATLFARVSPRSLCVLRGSGGGEGSSSSGTSGFHPDERIFRRRGRP